MIYTIEKLDKSDKLSEKLKDLTINNSEYYVSNSATTNHAKCDPASDPKIVNHTSDGIGKVTETSNGILQRKIFSYRTLPVVVPTMDPRIDDRIAMIGGALCSSVELGQCSCCSCVVLMSTCSEYYD